MSPRLSVDVHVIILDRTPKDWVKQCIESIHAAARFSPFMVHLFTVEGVLGHIGVGRAKGYALGNSPYVTYVDDDDYLIPEAFHEMSEALEQEPDAAFPGEYVLENNQHRVMLRRHHLPFYRREHIIDHTKWIAGGDPQQIHAVRDMRIIDVPKPVYVHRMYLESASRPLLKAHPEELENIRPMGNVLKSMV